VIYFLRHIRFSILVLIGFHLLVVMAGFISTADPEQQNRSFDKDQRFHLRPFFIPALPTTNAASSRNRDDNNTVTPLRFFVSGSQYKILGVFDCNVHLFGVAEPSQIFLLGTDSYGRDEFSRLLYGGRISLLSGLIATLISLCLGMLIGGMAGFYGGWVDSLFMRAADSFLTVPWLYLLLGVRALLPLRLNPNWVFLLLVAVLGSVGWARPARLIRGVVLSAKETDFVLAARGFGASDFYILRRHILPFAADVIFTQACLLVPQYILAEVALSFFGLGVNEPVPSWGNMLSQIQRYSIFTSCWWLFAPAVTLILVSLAYQHAFKNSADSAQLKQIY
jgi:peptide/nickel transport system permease protein